MTIPSAKYLLDKQGKKTAVQLSLQDWEQLVEEFERMSNLLNFKQELKEAFREVRQIQRGEKKGTTLNEFLNEL